MNDVEIVTAIVVRMINEGNYYCFTDSFLTLDGTTEITPEEAKVLERVTGKDGQGWWESHERT